MAKREVNKSEEIRNELKKTGGKGKPAQIVDILAARGVEVTAGQVANVKTKFNQQGGAASSAPAPRREAKEAAAPVSVASVSGSGVPQSKDVQALLVMQKIVEQYGVGPTKQLIDEIAKARLPF